MSVNLTIRFGVIQKFVFLMKKVPLNIRGHIFRFPWPFKTPNNLYLSLFYCTSAPWKWSVTWMIIALRCTITQCITQLHKTRFLYSLSSIRMETIPENFDIYSLIITPTLRPHSIVDLFIYLYVYLIFILL